MEARAADVPSAAAAAAVDELEGDDEGEEGEEEEATTSAGKEGKERKAPGAPIVPACVHCRSSKVGSCLCVGVVRSSRVCLLAGVVVFHVVPFSVRCVPHR